MRLARYNADKLGFVKNEQLIDVTEALDEAGDLGWPVPPGDRLVAALDRVCARVEELRKWGFVQLHKSVSLKSPVANPSKVIGAPSKYRAQIDETNADPKSNSGTTATTIEDYGLFLKNPVLIGPGEDIALAFANRPTNHKVELAIVIGKPGKNVDEADALDHVAGYAIGLDLTVSGKEGRSLRKPVDGISVLGPWLVTADEIPDPDALSLKLSVNGDLCQDTSTATQILDCSKLIAYASRFYTLIPGDVILTGTAEGAGLVLSGDVMTCQIEGIGAMEVAVRAA